LSEGMQSVVLRLQVCIIHVVKLLFSTQGGISHTQQEWTNGRRVAPL